MSAEIEHILKTARTIAIVGLSNKPYRPSYGVAEYLIRVGYKVIPVNPWLEKWQDIKCYPDLHTIGHTVDVVDIFRRSDQVMPIVQDAIEIHAGCIWMQLGVVNPEAAARAAEAGLRVVMDRCIKIDHRALLL